MLHVPGRAPPRGPPSPVPPPGWCLRNGRQKADAGIRNGPVWKIVPRKPCTTVTVVQVITRDGDVPAAIPGGWFCRSPIHGASMSPQDDLETGWTSGGSVSYT